MSMNVVRFSFAIDLKLVRALSSVKYVKQFNVLYFWPVQKMADAD